MSDHRSARPRSNTLRALLVGALVGCGADGSVVASNDSRAAEDLRFLRPAADAPPLANPVVQFYARRGQTREVFVYYRPRAGRTDSTDFARFRVRASSLVQRPDGSPIAVGDSILITIRVIDPSRLILDFQPSGLRFAASDPADLRIRFVEAHHDFDGDGDVDGDDAATERLFSIWRQEAPGLPWLRMTSVVETTLDEVEADVLGFTGYAIAY